MVSTVVVDAVSMIMNVSMDATDAIAIYRSLMTEKQTLINGVTSKKF